MGLQPHVRPGDPQRIEAETFNAMLDAAAATRQATPCTSGSQGTSPPQPGIVLVRNTSNQDFPQFACVSLEDAPITPENNLGGFCDRVILNCDMPGSNDEGRFAILQEPLPRAEGETYPIARAVVDGVTPALLYLTNTTDEFCDLDAGSYYVRNSPAGSAQILWQPGDLGAQLGIVRVWGKQYGKSFVCLTTSAITARSGTTPGVGTALLYKSVNGTLTPTEFEIVIRNHTTKYVANNTVTRITQDAYGVWWVEDIHGAPWIIFALESDGFDTGDASATATVIDYWGGAAISVGAAVTVWNLLTHNAGAYVFAGDANYRGIAVFDEVDQIWRIIQMECAAAVENLSTWQGSTAITTLGTITTGVWSGTTIAIAKGGTGATTASGALDNLGFSGFVKSFINDADAETARSTLGLGTAAVETIGTSGSTVPLLSVANTWSAAQTFPNSSGVKILDTNASHTLGLIVGSNITADRTLTITTGDANRTLDISAASVTVSAYGATLTDDADAETARSTLGLGTAATQNTGTSGANVPLLNGANTWSGTQAFSSTITVNATILAAQAVQFTGVVSPPQITSDQNDYAPTGITTLSVLRLDADAARSITGLTNGGSGRVVFVQNVGSNAITLVNESASSTAANRFLFGADLKLGADQCAALMWDAGVSRWRNAGSAVTLTGDVTGSGPGTFAATIANDAVTYAKMQNVSATDRLLGRSTAGSGDVEEITCTSFGRALLDDTSAAAQCTTLGLGTGNGPTFKNLTVSDTDGTNQVLATYKDTAAEVRIKSFSTLFIALQSVSADTSTGLLSSAASAGFFVEERVSGNTLDTLACGSLLAATWDWQIRGGASNYCHVVDGDTGNSIIGGKTFPTDATFALVFAGAGAEPSAAVADRVQFWGKDTAAGQRNIHSYNEEGKSEQITGLKVRVSAQFDKTSSTTLGNITGLSRNVEAGKSYAFRAVLFTTSNIAGGVKAAIAGTATATAIINESIVTQAGAMVAPGTTRATALATAVGDVTAVTTATITLTGLITVNAAGTLTVQFAQNASNGSASSVLVGSYFELIPIGS